MRRFFDFFFFSWGLNAFNVKMWQCFQLFSTLFSGGKLYHLQVSKAKDYIFLSDTVREQFCGVKKPQATGSRKL